jgi:hypothetical protein
MRLGVTVREAGWLLGLSEPQVRRRLAEQKLSYVVSPNRIDVESIRAAFPRDEFLPVREAALEAVLKHRVTAPKPNTRYAQPIPITELPRLLSG